LFAVGLFVCCLLCHGELARLKPHPRYLTAYYLMISVGGALGGLLVGVIELVSPANKKEQSEREAFVSKCVAYLKRGIGLVVIDVVTERHANLHNQLMEALGAQPSQLLSDTPIYVSGYRPVHRRDTRANELEVWPYAATIGGLVPAVPLGLRGGPVVLLNLEGTYTAAIEATGL
ncbi:MAG: DUF4058 family protein, partial [Gemmataceae bacterium]|nr:DUF4058 family protein [Gemmataceae bacterium]